MRAGRDFVAECFGRLEIGAKLTAVQTLREFQNVQNFAKRLDCGAFTAALVCGWKLGFTEMDESVLIHTNSRSGINIAVIEMNSENLITQARARIIWGEAPSSVRVFLIANGIPASEADSVIDEVMAERTRELRMQGIFKICLGSALVIGALLFFLVSYRSIDLDGMNIRAGRIFVATAVLIGVAGLYGVSKLIDGIIYVVRPQSENKSISEI